MTQAVARAGQSAAEAIAQPAVSKATVGTLKASGRVSSNEARSKPLEKTDEGATSDVPVSTPRPMQKSAKTDSRPMDDMQTGDADSTFAATIDDMNSASGQPLPDAAPALTWSAELVIAAQSALAQAPQDKAGVAEVQQTLAKVPLGAANLLKQESIAALLSAKDRLAASQFSATSDQNPIAAASVVVNSKETHWSFNGKTAPSTFKTAVAAADVPLNADQGEGLKLGALSAGKEATRSNSVAEPIAAKSSHDIASSQPSKAFELIAPPAAPQLAKVQDALPKPAPNMISPADPQSVAAPAFTDPSSGQTSDGGQQDAANARQQTSSNKPALEVVGPEPFKAAERATDDASTSPATPAVTSQLSSRIVDTLAGRAGEAQASELTSATPQQRPPTSPQVLRTIDVTLSPADLGSVRLKLTLKSNTLAIEAEASKASTAQILHNDRTTLEHSLRGAGYDVSSVKITDSSAASSGSGNWQSGGSAFREGEQSRSTFAGRQDGEFQRRDGAAPDRGQQRPGNNAGQNPSAADTQIGRQSNAIYI